MIRKINVNFFFFLSAVSHASSIFVVSAMGRQITNEENENEE
jgi:hypothetical protein